MSDNRISRVLKRAVSLAIMLSLAAGILIFTPEKAEAAASQFDMNFGTAGKVVTDFGGFDTLSDIAIQADGKIVAVGSGSMEFDFAVARYNINGTLDTGFDGDGKVTTDFGAIDTARAVAIQPDGKIVVLGSGGGNFCLARYNSNGSLDTAFDGDGKVITDLPDSQIGNDIVIQPDGKIVVAGRSSGGLLTDDFIVARYNPNGTLDSTFNTNGYVITPFPGLDVAHAVALQSDGKIIAVGQSSADFSVFRYNSNGSLDTSFDTDGIVTTNIAGTDIAHDVIIQPDGKIIAAGEGASDFALARYNADGSLDSTFDSDGKVVVDMGSFDTCYAAALQPNGKIVAVGNAENSGMAVARFNPTGALDTSFHGDGKLNTIITSSSDNARAVAIQNDGKIVVGGSPTGGTVNFALTRFLGDPQKSFTNFNAIVPPDRTVNTNPPGVPSNYPSIADINGASGTVTKVRVTLTNVNHTFPDDFDVLLVGPNGQRTILMSDVGGGNPGVTNRTYIFDQSAATEFPNNNPPSGIYKPINNVGPAQIEPGGIDVFPAPGPGSANYGAANLDVFNGTNPNGIWRLYVVDDEAGDVGGMSTFTLEVTTTTSRLNNLTADYDGDGRTDISIFRPSNGHWWRQSSLTNQVTAATFGVNTDKIAPADFTGDGKTDIAFWRPSNGQWFVLRSEDNTFFAFPFGTNGDVPQPADYDGDGRADAAVFRVETRTWFILNSSGGTTIQQFGAAGDIPVTADYDGDGKSDIGIYRPNGATGGAEWWHQRSSNNTIFATQFGIATDKPVAADYTGDGKADIAFFRPSIGTWFILRSEDLSFFAFPFGANGDRPAPGDYDGDGKADAALFRPSDTTWYIRRSTDSGTTIQQFGTTGDIPTPSAFIP